MSDGSCLASQPPQARALHGTTAQGRALPLERRWNVGKPGRRGLRSIFRPSHPGLIWACSHAKPCIKQLSPPHLRSRNVEARWNVEARQPPAARSIGTPASRSSLTLRPTIKVRCRLRTLSRFPMCPPAPRPLSASSVPHLMFAILIVAQERTPLLFGSRTKAE